MAYKGKGGASHCGNELHVLAVDDNLVERKLIEKLLKSCSYKAVTIAESGMKALEYLGLEDGQENSSEGLKVDLVLTDYCMPGMTGYDLLKKIKESPHMKEVPVVIMSSENVPERITKCLEEGAEMFILKPLTVSDVLKVRSEVLQCRS